MGLLLVPVPKSLGLVPDDVGAEDAEAEDAVAEDGAGDVGEIADDGVPGGPLEEAAAGGFDVVLL